MKDFIYYIFSTFHAVSELHNASIKKPQQDSHRFLTMVLTVQTDLYYVAIFTLSIYVACTVDGLSWMYLDLSSLSMYYISGKGNTPATCAVLILPSQASIFASLYVIISAFPWPFLSHIKIFIKYRFEALESHGRHPDRPYHGSAARRGVVWDWDAALGLFCL